MMRRRGCSPPRPAQAEQRRGAIDRSDDGRTMMLRTLTGAVIAAVLAGGAAGAEDRYTIGLTGALTGPPASTYAPAVEALRLYVDRLNAAGGVGGKKINFILQD